MSDQNTSRNDNNGNDEANVKLLDSKIHGLDHFNCMETAVKLARYALDHDETPVACIFIHSKLNKIVSYGMNNTNNSENGIQHAEFVAINLLKENLQKFQSDINSINFNDIIVYVTVEPCIMCASALKQIGVKKIYFGCANERFGGNGTVLSINNDTSTILKNNLVKSDNDNKQISIPGLYRKEAIMLLRYFYVRENKKSPNPRIKLERNLDKDNFPPINWQQYTNASLFGQEFGSENLINFNNQKDLFYFKLINWKLIDSNYDTLLKDLDNQININLNYLNNNINENKKIKI